MRLLFLNRVYPPADGATGHLLGCLANGLASAGHDVTVITSRLSPADAPSEIRDGVRVERVSVLPFTRSSHIKRTLGYLSVYPALLWRALRLPRADIVITMTDPPLTLVLGPVLKLVKRSRLLHWAQDIYPELAEQLGVLGPNKFPAKLLRFFSTAALRRHDHIITVGRCMCSRLLTRGIDPARMSVIPNWSLPLPPEDAAGDTLSFRIEHRLLDKFLVIYSGNFGIAHPFEAIIQAAELLQARQPKVVFLMIGGGPRLSEVKQAGARLDNIRFLPFQPREKLGQSLRAADVHLASMREDLCGLVVPSKVYGVLAAGRPCIFLGPPDSEAALLLRENHCGLVLPSRDGHALASSVLRLFENPAELGEMRENARRLSQNLAFSPALESFQKLFRSGPADSSPMPKPASIRG